MSTARIYDSPLTIGKRITVLMVLAIAGLFYVKWCVAIIQRCCFGEHDRIFAADSFR
jgi:hypothetical protein